MITRNSGYQLNLARFARKTKSLEAQLARNSKNSRAIADRFNETRHMLDGLLVETPLYDTANKRIDNAERYISQGETGAAQYEIRLLLGSMRNHFKLHGVTTSQQTTETLAHRPLTVPSSPHLLAVNGVANRVKR